MSIANIGRFPQTPHYQYLGSTAKGIRALLNGDGAIAMKKGITTDSKDNGAVEEMFWQAMNTAGFTEADL